MTNDWDLDYVGILVNDLADAIKYYQLLGFQPTNVSMLKKLDGNNPLNYHSCLVECNTFRIELIEPVKDGDLFHQHLDKYGEGTILFGFHVTDLPKEKDRLTNLGIPIIASSNRKDGSEMQVLFDTRQYGNIIMFLFSEPASFPIFKPSVGKWRFNHLGLVVNDTDKLAEYYQSIGFKPLMPPGDSVR